MSDYIKMMMLIQLKIKALQYGSAQLTFTYAKVAISVVVDADGDLAQEGEKFGKPL